MPRAKNPPHHRTEKTKGENALADICTALKVLVLCPEANIVYTTS